MNTWLRHSFSSWVLLGAVALSATTAAAQCPTAAVGAPGVPTWRLSLDRIQVVQQRESGGDRPYFASLVFRSCFGGAGTSQVTLVEREPHDWVSKPEQRAGVSLRRGDHMSNGESLRVPDWMGRFEWGGMPLVSAAGPIPSAPPWLFGVAIISFDNNNTPPHVIRNIMNTLRTNMLGVLQREVETGRVLTWTDDDWSGLQTAMTNGITTFSNVFQLTIGSTFNPDKPTGIQLLAWYGADDVLRSVGAPAPTTQLNFPTGDQVVLGQSLGNPLAATRTLRFQGSGAIYDVATRIERIGGECVSWTRINRRDRLTSIAACGNGRVYALHTDGTLASTDGRSVSAAWSVHGRLAGATRLACAGRVLYFLGTDRQLFNVAAPALSASVGTPRRLGRPFAAATIAAAFNGDMPAPWALNDDKTLWYNNADGADGRWVRVGQPIQAMRIAAAPGRLFALNGDRTLWISTTGRDDSWRQIDRPAAAVDITATAAGEREPVTLYALNGDGSLWRGSVTP